MMEYCLLFDFAYSRISVYFHVWKRGNLIFGNRLSFNKRSMLFPDVGYYIFGVLKLFIPDPSRHYSLNLCDTPKDCFDELNRLFCKRVQL